MKGETLRSRRASTTMSLSSIGCIDVNSIPRIANSSARINPFKVQVLTIKFESRRSEAQMWTLVAVAGVASIALAFAAFAYTYGPIRVR
jgi:hypothetical protein